MFGFGTKKNNLSREQALDSRPAQLAKCELIAMPDGGAKVKVPLKQRKFGGWIFRVPEHATKTFELDSMGVTVWQLCDGKTSVLQIIRKLAKDNGLSHREVEVSTVQFLQTLVRKGLLGMTVPDKKKDEG